MSDFGQNFGPPAATVREGAAEVKAKLKSDFSKVARSRRSISIKPMMGCRECDATGRIPCSSCDGSGQAKVQFGDTPEACHTCEGRSTVTCVDCAGRGLVPNIHRKKILWLIAIGVACWAFALWRLWGGDVLPEQVANIKGGGGSSKGPANHVRPASNVNQGVSSQGSSFNSNGGGPVGSVTNNGTGSRMH